MSASEIVVMDVFRLHTQRIEHLVDSRAHRAGAAHVILDVLGIVMILQIGVVDHLMHKARSVAYARCVGCRIRTVERQMEMEIGKILLKLQEIVEIKHLVERPPP